MRVSLVGDDVKQAEANPKRGVNKQPVGRFPQYGTVEHADTCGWAYRKETSEEANCTLLVRSKPEESQGLSQCMCDCYCHISLIYSLQTGCHLLLDYGVGMDIDQV